MNAVMRISWPDTARKDAINMLREAIKEMEEHPERFAEYHIQIAPLSAVSRTHSITVVFEIPAEAGEPTP
jgi:hypothetical protein